MSTIRHAHSSSFYQGSPLSLAKQVKRAVEAKDPNATVLTFTEVGSPARTRVLEQADPENWAAWVPNASDVGLMWRRKQWQPRWKEPHKLTNKVWHDGHGRKHETWCATALLEHRDGPSLFLSVCHLPSHVQHGDRFYDNAQAAAWKSACSGWHEYWNACRKRDHPELAMLVADWNVDFHSAHWRDVVGSYYPNMTLGWARNMPPASQGTHGRRLIDGTMATGRADDCRLLKDDLSSDHRPYGEVLPWPA